MMERDPDPDPSGLVTHSTPHTACHVTVRQPHVIQGLPAGDAVVILETVVTAVVPVFHSQSIKQ